MTKPSAKRQKAVRKRKPRPGADNINLVLRVRPEVVQGLDEMAAELGVSRNMLAGLMVRQAVALYRAGGDQPGLFGGVEQLIESALRKAMGGKP